MIGPILAFAIVTSAPQSTTARDGILNGTFEGVLDVSGKPLRTGFWVVAGEDARSLYIPQDPGGYYVQLQRQSSLRDQIAYQMVGCPLDKAETAEVAGWVYLSSADSEARVSVSAGGGEFWSLHWVTKGTFFRPGDLQGTDLVRWEVWQSEDGSSPEQFTYTTDPQAQGNRYKFIDPSGTTLPNNSITQTGPTRLRMKVQSPAGGYIETRWIAPREGWVRVMNRPYFYSNPVPQGGTPSDFDLKYEIYHNASTTPITSVALDSNNGEGEEGIVLVERIWVDDGDQIRFRASKASGMSQNEDDAIFFDGQPVVAYEGNTVTYRITNANPPADVTDSEEEKFVVLPVPGTGWQQMDGDPETSGIQPIAAGAKLSELFYDNEDVPPPLCVKLSAPALGSSGPSGPVGFDEIACMIEWDDVTVDDLREAIYDEARWMRENQLLGILDHSGHGWQKGPDPSFYAAHKLQIRSGPLHETTNPGFFDVQGNAPPFLWEVLRRWYDSTDYIHFFSIWEKKIHPENIVGESGFLWELFNTRTDVFLTGTELPHPADPYWFLPTSALPDHYPNGALSPMQAMIELYRATNDPWYLDRAYGAAQVHLSNGIYTEQVPQNPPSGTYQNQTRTGMIAPKGYSIATGQLLQGVGDLVSVYGLLLDPQTNLPAHTMTFGNLTAVVNLLDVYTAKVAGNPSSQTTLESACEDCIDTCRFFRNPAVYFNGGNWAAKWQSHDGAFNDHFGYQSRDAIRMRNALLELEAANNGLSSGEQDMLDALESFWFAQGTQNFYEPWAQLVARNEFLPGDHARGWNAYLNVILDETIALAGQPAPDRDDMEELLKTAAFHALKFQYVGGIWTSGGLGRFQQADLGAVQLGPPGVYITGLAHALELPNLTASEESYLLSALMAFMQANQRYFKANHINTSGPAGQGDGYGYWPNVFYGPPAQDEWPAGAERRSLGGFFDVLDALDRTHPAVLPSPVAEVISPTSGQHTSGSVTYQFKLSVPGADSTSLLQDALEDRTRLLRWDGDSLAGWSFTEYSTATSGGDITVTAYNHTANPPYVTFNLTQSVPAPGDGERFKYAMVTWDTTLRWDQDTTVQAND